MNEMRLAFACLYLSPTSTWADWITGKSH